MRPRSATAEAACSNQPTTVPERKLRSDWAGSRLSNLVASFSAVAFISSQKTNYRRFAHRFGFTIEGQSASYSTPGQRQFQVWDFTPIGDQQEDVVAHISPHVFYVAQRQRGGRQGCTGAVAAFNGKDDVGHLHAGPESAEASGAKQGGLA